MLWRVQAAASKGFGDQRADKAVKRWQTPRLIDKFGRLDSAAPGPIAFRARHYVERIFKQNFDVQILIRNRHHHSTEDNLDAAFPHVAILQSRRRRLRHVKLKLWKSTREPIDHSRNETRSHRLGAPNADLSGRWVGQELDLFDPLPQVVERGDGPFEQSTAIQCGLDALGSAIEETDAERVLDVGDRLRYSRLRHRELRRCLPHATALRDRH